MFSRESRQFVRRYLSVDAHSAVLLFGMLLAAAINPFLFLFVFGAGWSWRRDLPILLGFQATHLLILLLMGFQFLWKAKRGRRFLEEGSFVCGRVESVTDMGGALRLPIAFEGADGRRRRRSIMVMSKGPLKNAEAGQTLVFPTRRVAPILTIPAEAFVDDTSEYLSRCRERVEA